MRRWIVLGVLLPCLAGCGGSDLPLKEPTGGLLDPGQSVLVNDGRCPAGQVSKVTAPTSLTGTRTYSCVKAPAGGLF